jgi:hypothetical protein
MIKIKNLSLFLFSFMLAFAACQEDPEVTGEPPTVNAGTDVNAVVGSSVQLSGIATDPDGDQLTISWTVTAAPSGSTASVNNANSLNAAFTPDVAGNYTLTLTVNDGNGNTVTDELIITATEAVGEPPVVTILGENNRAISEANENNSVTVGTPYMLNGSNTFDQDTDADDLTFTWEITEAPAGSSEASVSADATDPAMANFVPDVVGDYTIQLTVTDPEGNSDSETAIIMADANPVEISSSISTPTVWPNVFENPSLPDYYVTADITVSEQLEVMPGVKVMFEPNMRMTVSGNRGALTALGKADSLVVFTAEDSLNGWEGIVFFNNNVLNQLDYIDISYGGKSDFGSGVAAANIGVEFGDAVSITNSIISNSFNHGVFVENGGLLPEFGNNRVRDNANHPLSLPINQVGNLDELSTFTDNGNNSVEISASTLSQDDEMTVVTLSDGTPYFVNGKLDIDSGIKFSAGANLEFDSDAFVEVSGNGYISAIGTATDNIRFTANDQANGWGGIVFFTNFAQTDFQYCSFSYGGNRSFGAGVEPSIIGVEFGDQIKISNSTIANSVGEHGIFVENGGIIAEFENNTFINNSDLPLSLPISTAGVLDENSSFSGNGDNSVEIRASRMRTDVGPQTLPAFTDGTPYFVSGKLDIDDALTISAGATLEFTQNAFLEIAGDGSIDARGTVDDKITMTARNQADGWKGIVIFTNTASNKFDYVDISYGGNGDFGSGVLASCIGIEFGDKAAISNTSFSNSFGYGLFVESGGIVTDDGGTELTTQAELETAGNTFSGNTTDPSNLP